ncbi:hypothetical protein MYAM1_000941 [Malassezia yamatoensis]|uniref:alanine--glyoxylate transaminase n=1 Tax=Malassezia yamatoensis TaxID=253288 RepID=A0AAJ6CHV3_9BASI|nr:hypothetical protein MYAM1_000941 [Malassezia yamatoensis]
MKFEQDAHETLMVPGFVEFEDDVLYANANPAIAPVSPEFVAAFNSVLKNLRSIVYASDSTQPIVVAGSGNMGWDMATLNVLEPGDKVLVLQTGHFSDLYDDSLQPYGIQTTKLLAPLGNRPSLDEIRTALKKDSFRAISITQVDTSSGVLNDVKAIASLVHEVSPSTLVFVDAVCSVASEELRFDDWGIDLILTAPQQGLATPPGISIMLVGPRALEAYQGRKAPPATYFLSWDRWIPVMKSFESGPIKYFATPPTNLILALNKSLDNILHGDVSLEERLQKNIQASHRVKEFVSKMGLKQLVDEDLQKAGGAANSLTTIRYPKGITAQDILPKMAQRGIIIGAGIHQTCKDEYFRIGHIGSNVIDTQRDDIGKLLKNLEEVLKEAGYR